MRKFIIVLSVVTIMFPIFVFAEETSKRETSLIPNARSGVLMEASTGKIIFEKEKDAQVAVASMTKMVLQIIVLEKIEEGKIKWTDIVEVSKNASDMGGSQIYLEAGEKMSIKDLFKGVSMASANDATVALAEVISGSEEAFVKLMNQKVKDLGLKNTNFKNSTGLDEEDHYSSAYDMAVIARELLKHQEILNFSSVYEDYLRVDTPNKFWLVNTNKLVRFYEGADGLKTGHTDAAKYCLAATAKQNDLRLIAIVLGEENSKVRNNETMSLLDYGFQNYKMKVLKKQGEKVKEISITKADNGKIVLVPSYDIGVLQKKTDEDANYTYEVKVNKFELPVQKGDVLGKIYVKKNNEKISEGELVAKKTVKPLKFFQLYLEIFKDTIIGVVN